MGDRFEVADCDAELPVAGIVLAAGLSTRMGRFKLTLPWDSITVVGRVAQMLADAGLADIVVVTGHRADDVASALAGYPVRVVYNPEYRSGEMLPSVKVGLRALGSDILAALLCLGDQPQIEVGTVHDLFKAGHHDGWRRIVVPSYDGKAGHPILLPRSVWPTIWNGRSTLRDILREQPGGVRYLEVGTATVLADLDTPGEYFGTEG